MADFLAEKRKELNGRLTELGPVVAEAKRLEAALAALDEIPPASTNGAAAASAKRGSRRRGRPPGSKTRVTKAATGTPAASETATHDAPRRKAGRRKGGGKRAAQVLALVQAQPGITIPEMAKAMGMNQTYLYRVLPTLEQAGKVTKQGRAWHPK